MMVNVNIILFMLFLHWLGDSVMQSEKQALTKYKDMNALLDHTAIYSLCLVPMCFFLELKIVMFVAITFIAHTLTDLVTSKINHRLWREKKEHKFFVMIFFDQLLHFVQLFYTYYLLSN